MTPTHFAHALIVGAGAGISASLARLFAQNGLGVTLAARTPEKLAALCAETGARALPADAADRASISALFDALDAGKGGAPGAPDVVIFNPSARARGSILELDPNAVARALAVSAMGAFLVAQEAARRMAPAGAAPGHGAILFTGASASVKGFALSAPFAMGKFAQRGLAQSLARELHPRGVHVACVNVDGGVRNAAVGRLEGPDDAPDAWLDPDAVAQAFWYLLMQDRSCWSTEIDVRPWVETF